MASTIRTTAVFLQPFRLAGFDEILPAGEYDLETELVAPVDWIEPGSWASSVLVHLHARASHPGLNRTLTVALAELETVMARDNLTGKSIIEFFLEEMLADPIIRLVMQADSVSEAEIRGLYSQAGPRSAGERAASLPADGVHAGSDGTRETSSRQGTGERYEGPSGSPCDFPERIGMPASGIVPTIDELVDLDGRRSPESKMEIEARRWATTEFASQLAARRRDNGVLEAQMQVEPARKWSEAMVKTQFLLGRYSATPEAQDARVRKLIRRALSDMARLAKREERRS